MYGTFVYFTGGSSSNSMTKAWSTEATRYACMPKCTVSCDCHVIVRWCPSPLDATLLSPTLRPVKTTRMSRTQQVHCTCTCTCIVKITFICPSPLRMGKHIFYVNFLYKLWRLYTYMYTCTCAGSVTYHLHVAGGSGLFLETKAETGYLHLYMYVHVHVALRTSLCAGDAIHPAMQKGVV